MEVRKDMGQHAVWKTHHNIPLLRVGSVSLLSSCLHTLGLPTALILNPLPDPPTPSEHQQERLTLEINVCCWNVFR